MADTHTFPSVEKRLRHRSAWVFVALDTIDALTDHVIGLLGPDEHRRMTIVQRYLRSDGDRGDVAGSLTIKTSLTRAGHGTRYPGGIDRHTQSNPFGKALTVWLGPGIEAFGFGAYAHEAATEDAVRARYHDTTRRREDITLLHLNGFPGEPTKDDRVVIEHWNQFGVCSEVTVALDGWNPADKATEETR